MFVFNVHKQSSYHPLARTPLEVIMSVEEVQSLGRSLDRVVPAIVGPVQGLGALPGDAFKVWGAAFLCVALTCVHGSTLLNISLPSSLHLHLHPRSNLILEPNPIALVVCRCILSRLKRLIDLLIELLLSYISWR